MLAVWFCSWGKLDFLALPTPNLCLSPSQNFYIFTQNLACMCVCTYGNRGQFAELIPCHEASRDLIQVVSLGSKTFTHWANFLPSFHFLFCFVLFCFYGYRFLLSCPFFYAVRLYTQSLAPASHEGFPWRYGGISYLPLSASHEVRLNRGGSYGCGKRGLGASFLHQL